MDAWLLHVSLLVLLARAAWVYVHRRRDLWMLLGVTALVARFWTYHRMCEGLLVLLPAVTLFRVPKQGPRDNGPDVSAGRLLAATPLPMLLRGPIRYAPSPSHASFTVGHTLVWASVLVLLLCGARVARIGR